MEMGKIKELERSARFDLQILGRLSIEGSATADSCLCNTINISVTGALIETGFAVPSGALIRYSFTIPGTDRTVDVAGEVVRAEVSSETMRRTRSSGEAPRKLQRYGIMFLDLSHEDRTAIEDFLGFYRKRSMEQPKA
ncbi:MAG TPA: hypothetical protein DDW94_08590 [Deltaproteobacteria bacterium]|nr:MAG: hypothetical protein A2Z79_03105 [Deltaproteobacteria bacterium GWA2_55_82]OGQ62271.1 MAG: hypothetical protein A3I81_05015 [Deltaproteobacteria bacterium RIFCSPLOWO2_02_FULL_55_12]OIJ74383.1 MAG: hypothetical protein A2V21_309005 [Deltaproteobacteria bacterium GWC2_55_46]HBG47031.1 hypothetical protein [Deltaproteobacteria bacterium]HCY10909.1 hypothetical protein [Deltaproteobacteria bacterium]